MLNDAYGNPVTTNSADTIKVIDAFVDSYIGFGTDFSGIFGAADRDPDCAIAAAYATLLGLFVETPARVELSTKYANQAKAALGNATERERIFTAAVLCLRELDVAGALAHFRTLASDHPGDLFAIKLGQNTYFNLGDDDGLLWLINQVFDRHKDCAYAYGMRAFGHEQKSNFGQAEADGRLATEMKRKEPWAHHAVAHVLLTQGRHDEGIKWMDDLSNEWDDRNSFMFTHNWWHQALFFLEQEDFQTPLKLYDEKIWGVDKTYSLDQVNAISLLWRLEQLGVDVGDRWTDLSSFVAARTLINDQPFFDMHYVYALARGGHADALEALMAGAEKLGRDAPGLTRAVWSDVAVPSMRGYISLAQGDHKGAVRQMAAAQPRLQEIGGSHAQRDMFQLAWVTSLVEAGKFDRALPILEARLAFRQGVAMDTHLLENARARAT
ncbi:tetratricopeptide repeat protein [Sneathiella marina]|uniref:Tetratricopeptide repeat protein 38 n=1 Tax=Sneathiella marina TaxID=2950108 RepID=A0ABY4W0Q6_9PROT|nr:tetratricopeptide repeat protein [Sneathiella marina]USG60792.1 tetratricopeptide repeat protein [Sneathiella marina]